MFWYTQNITLCIHIWHIQDPKSKRWDLTLKKKDTANFLQFVPFFFQDLIKIGWTIYHTAAYKPAWYIVYYINVCMDIDSNKWQRHGVPKQWMREHRRLAIGWRWDLTELGVLRPKELSSIVSIRLTLVIQKLAIESISLVVDLLYKVTECSGYTFATI